MKRSIALCLACCLLISSLCVTAFAADDSILLKNWSCSTVGKTITVASSASSGGSFEVPKSTGSAPDAASYRFTADSSIAYVYNGCTGVLSFVWDDSQPTYKLNGYVDGVKRNDMRFAISDLSSFKFDFVWVKRTSGYALLLYVDYFCTLTGGVRNTWFDLAAGSVNNTFTSVSLVNGVSSDAVTYVFDASLSTRNLGSSPVEAIYTDFPGWSGVTRSVYNLYELPASTSISTSLAVTVDGFSGFGSDSTMPLGSFSVYSVDINGKAQDLLLTSAEISPNVSGSSYVYSFHDYVKLLKSVDTYVSSLFFCFTLTGNSECTLAGKTLTCTVSSADIFVKSLGTVVTDTDKNIEETTKNIYESVISGNAEVVRKLTSIYDRLKSIGVDTDTIKTLMQQLVTAVNGLGTDLDAVLAYLEASQNQIAHLAMLLQTIADKLQLDAETLSSILAELVTVGADVKLCVTYLTGINNSIGMLGATIEEMRDYLETNTQTLRDILAEILTFDDYTRGQLRDILENLTSQGITLDGMKAYLASIKMNTTQANSLLTDLLDELKKVEAENTETNDRLKAIQDALDDFELDLNQTVNNVMSESDKQGLAGIISKIVNRLLSVVDFVGDLFGDVFTSIPSTISAFNDCNSFWGDSKTYVYTPHQLSGFTGQGGSGYENSNASVQNLFTEAEKYLGYPYVFGGSSPETSFDCSGFVCYALNHSGVYSIDRTTAQGLYDASTKISELDAAPGDLIFFTGTYNSGSAVSHVGIYAGNGKMLHCGDVRPDRTKVEVDERRIDEGTTPQG